MRPQPLDQEAVTDLAAARGIDSVSELARRCGISRPYLSRVLRGERPAQPSQIIAIAEALDVDPNTILKEEASA